MLLLVLIWKLTSAEEKDAVENHVEKENPAEKIKVENPAEKENPAEDPDAKDKEEVLVVAQEQWREGREDVEPDADAEVDVKKEADISNMEVIFLVQLGIPCLIQAQDHGLQDPEVFQDIKIVNKYCKKFYYIYLKYSAIHRPFSSMLILFS